MDLIVELGWPDKRRDPPLPGVYQSTCRRRDGSEEPCRRVRIDSVEQLVELARRYNGVTLFVYGDAVAADGGVEVAIGSQD